MQEQELHLTAGATLPALPGEILRQRGALVNAAASPALRAEPPSATRSVPGEGTGQPEGIGLRAGGPESPRQRRAPAQLGRPHPPRFSAHLGVAAGAGRARRGADGSGQRIPGGGGGGGCAPTPAAASGPGTPQ